MNIWKKILGIGLAVGLSVGMSIAPVYADTISILDEITLIIVEADLTTDFGYVEDLGYRQLRSKEYKTNKHIFLCRGK